MALIVCTECGKDVSEKAVSCPNCGAPISTLSSAPHTVILDKKSHTYTTRTGGKWEGVGFLMIVIGMVMCMTSNIGNGISLIFIGFIVFLIGRFK